MRYVGKTLHATKFTETSAASDSWQAKFFKNKAAKKAQRNMSVGELWSYKRDQSVAFLSLFILLFLFGSDDDKINWREKRTFKQVFKQKRGYLSDEDFKELFQYSKKILTFSDVVSYINKNEYSTKIVKSAIKLIKSYALKDPEYLKSLNRIDESCDSYIK